MNKRWTSCLAGLTATVLVLVPSLAPAQDTPGMGEALLPDPHEMARVEASVDRALEYLFHHQNDDGSWPSSYGRNHGITAVCLLGFLGRGHVPGRGPYQAVVDRAITHILATQKGNGLYKSPDASHGPMYEHALATLAMIEAYAFIPSLEMRRSVQKAVDLIVKSQNGEGGWRYQPVPSQADLSVTVMQVVALRAAMNARLNVPPETIEKALKYVRACASKKGGYAYKPGGGPGEARTAAGLLSMYLLGAFDDPTVERGLKWIAERKYHTGVRYFWYMNYYAMQAHFQAGGSWWANWHPQVRKTLLDNQRPDGSWPGYKEQKQNAKHSDCYSTGFAVLTLEVYMHYLPAYQR